ncbi:2'-5' RNA ligase family protein [Labilibacter marinus]|uniref:2'-5' RNA ligase family protein n=1 Tax=Labilibacter marinus TaxID=1477105 RepID=UPI00082971A6|nr:mutarotase [Labilibacter marinus]
MNLQEHYNKLYQDSIQKIQSDSYQTDQLIDSDNDKRYGITLLLRPDNIVKTNIQKLLSKVKAIEPHQYYYRSSDIHVTVMSIISCYDEFDLNQIRVENYIDTINKSIKGLSGFNIEFRGLTASPSCLMVQGFLKNDILNQFRNNLRADFRQTDLEQSMDKRYSIQTAHSTILRLKEKFKNKEKFLDILEEYRHYNFGSFKVDSLELVYNDWYQRKENVKTLHRFKLR